MPRAPRIWVIVTVAMCGVVSASKAGTQESRLAATVGVGVAYSREAWVPGGGNNGATYFGWGETVDVAVTHQLVPRLSMGADWMFSTLSEPQETYLSTTTVMSSSVRFVNAISGMVEYLLIPRFRIKVGATPGFVARTIWDRDTGKHVTAWGFGIGVHAGWTRMVSRRWSIGLLAETSIYRTSFGDVLPFGYSLGIVPAILVVGGFQ